MQRCGYCVRSVCQRGSFQLRLGPDGRWLRCLVPSRWPVAPYSRQVAYLLVVATSAALVALGLLSARAEGSTCPSGAGWTALSTPPLLVGWSGRGTDISGSLAVYGSEPLTLYLPGPPYGVLRSQDCGVTWVSVPSPWSGRPFGQATRTIAVDQAGRVYVLFYGAQLVMSDDGGLTWQSSGNVFYAGGDALGSVPYALAVGDLAERREIGVCLDSNPCRPRSAGGNAHP